MKEEEKKNNIFAIIIFLIILILLGIFLYARYVGTKGLIVKEYKIGSENLPASFNGLKIAHFSDFHLGKTTDIEDIEKLVNKINILKPDLIFFTGDLISLNKNITSKEENKIIELLSKLEATVGKYSIKGDIDYDTKSFDNIMLSSNFIVLENSFELIYSNGLTPIFLGGISSPMKKNIDLESTFSYFSSEEELYKATYKIILTHEGDIIKDILKYDQNIDLILGGNSLNGSIVIPYYGQLFLPKGSNHFYAPYYEENQTKIFISSGVGTYKYKLRLFNKPSFNFYRFKSL